MKQFRNPPDVHAPVGPYSHQIEISGERLLVISGQVGLRPDGTLPADPIEQMEAALDNILRNLQAAGMTAQDLVKMTYYLVDQIDGARRREVIAARFGDHQPCSTLIYVAALAHPDYRVEIEAWASKA